MSTTRKIGNLAKYLAGMMMAAQLGACGGPAGDEPGAEGAQIGQDKGAVSGGGWSGLPMKCDGASHTVTYTTPEQATVTLALKASGSSATELTVMHMSVTALGDTVKGMVPATTLGVGKMLPASGSFMGVGIFDNGYIHGSYNNQVAVSISGGKLLIGMPAGSYRYDFSSLRYQPPYTESFSAPATVVCQ